MHPILQRHLERVGLKGPASPPSAEQWVELLAAVGRSFGQFDSDRQLQERSMTIASEEMAELHRAQAAHNSELERAVLDRTAELNAALERAQAINVELASAKFAAEAASRTKSEFLAQMSHEVRTPLTAILGYADILRGESRTDATPDERLHALNVIHSTGQHLLAVLSDILDLSMVEAGHLVIEKKEISLPDLLSAVEAVLRPRAAEKRVGFALHLVSPVPQRIVTDSTRLRQILMNVAGNAVKFTEGGAVTLSVLVRTQDSGPRLMIDVEDTGCGVTPEQQSRLFKAFSQGDASMTRAHGGTGLGLAISRRLATLIGGDVTLVRTALGEGSCFRIDLPLEPVAGTSMLSSLPGVETHPAATTPAHTPKPATHDTGVTATGPVAGAGSASGTVAAPATSARPLAGRLLLVDDISHIRDIVGLYLRRAGAEVDVAENGQTALELIHKAARENRPYQLMVTDMQMPVMDGYTLAGTLRSQGSTLAIIALTAHAMSTELEKCLAAGCDAYATKPVDKAALIRTCLEWMNRRSHRAGHAKAA
jgi:signal transduction histidine kinase/ActR/RegA family two-component response regulator